MPNEILCKCFVLQGSVTLLRVAPLARFRQPQHPCVACMRHQIALYFVANLFGTLLGGNSFFWQRASLAPSPAVKAQVGQGTTPPTWNATSLAGNQSLCQANLPPRVADSPTIPIQASYASVVLPVRFSQRECCRVVWEMPCSLYPSQMDFGSGKEQEQAGANPSRKWRKRCRQEKEGLLPHLRADSLRGGQEARSTMAEIYTESSTPIAQCDERWRRRNTGSSHQGRGEPRDSCSANTFVTGTARSNTCPVQGTDPRTPQASLGAVCTECGKRATAHTWAFEPSPKCTDGLQQSPSESNSTRCAMGQLPEGSETQLSSAVRKLPEQEEGCSGASGPKEAKTSRSTTGDPESYPGCQPRSGRSLAGPFHGTAWCFAMGRPRHDPFTFGRRNGHGGRGDQGWQTEGPSGPISKTQRRAASDQNAKAGEPPKGTIANISDFEYLDAPFEGPAAPNLITDFFLGFLLFLLLCGCQLFLGIEVRHVCNGRYEEGFQALSTLALSTWSLEDSFNVSLCGLFVVFAFLACFSVMRGTLNGLRWMRKLRAGKHDSHLVHINGRRQNARGHWRTFPPTVQAILFVSLIGLTEANHLIFQNLSQSSKESQRDDCPEDFDWSIGERIEDPFDLLVISPDAETPLTRPPEQQQVIFMNFGSMEDIRPLVRIEGQEATEENPSNMIMYGHDGRPRGRRDAVLRDLQPDAIRQAVRQAWRDLS